MTRTILGIVTVAVVATGLFLVIVIDSSRLIEKTFPGFMIWDNGILLAFQNADWTGIQAGLPTKGRIVSVDGKPFRDRAALTNLVTQRPVGTPIHYAILQNGSVIEIDVPTMRFRFDAYLGTFGVYQFAGAICLLTALVVLYLKRDTEDARALTVMLFAVGSLFLLAVDFIGTSRFGRILPLFESITPFAILHFGAVFPRRRLPRKFIRNAAIAGYSIGLVYALMRVDLFHSNPELFWSATALGYLGIAVSLGLGLVGLGYSVVREPSSDQRVRAAVVFAGALSSCLVPAVAVPAFFLLSWDVSWSLIFAPIALFPIAVVYGVIRHDLFEAERFIRLSLGYSFASASAILLYSIILFTLNRTFFPDLMNSPVAVLIFVLVLVVSFNPFLKRAQFALDRYFYRVIVEPGRVLEDLAADLTDCEGEIEIRERVEGKLASALNLEWVELANDAVVSSEMDAQLVFPVTFRSEALSTLSCGGKLSGAPFAAVDRDLLSGAASQIGIALRNVRSMEALREAQTALLRKERLAAMGELAGSVAHGVRNPLSGIRASAQIARQQTSDPAMEETLTSIISESDRLEHRIRALLDFSRPFQPTIADVDVGSILESVRHSVAPQAERVGVHIDVSVGPETSLAACDENFLEEALLELAGNGIRIMAEAGGGQLQLSCGRLHDEIWIRVEDDGPGIPPNVQSRIFDLFFTTRADGTGMGLAVVKRIMDSFGGTISVSPEMRQGARFDIRLPMAEFAQPVAGI